MPLVGSYLLETQIVMDAAYRVHTRLGPGLLESAYEACLAYEIRKRGLELKCQVPLPLVYDDVRLDAGYRIDLLVEGKIIVEVKTIKAIDRIHCAQLLSYLRLTGCVEGMLFNFNSVRLKDGYRRILNDRPASTTH